MPFCPLCLRERKQRELQDGGETTLHQSDKPMAARVLECPESDYDASDGNKTQRRSHWREIRPVRPPTTAVVLPGWCPPDALAR